MSKKIIKRRLIKGISLFFVLFVFIFLSFRLLKTNSNIFPNINNDFSIKKEDKEKILSLFYSPDIANYSMLMQLVKKGEMNIINEFGRLRSKCPRNVLPQKCHQMILYYFADTIPFPENNHLVKLFNNYLEYVKFLAENSEIKNKNPEEKFYIIQRTRRKFFGEQDAEIIFGNEESKYKMNREYLLFLR